MASTLDYDAFECAYLYSSIVCIQTERRQISVYESFSGDEKFRKSFTVNVFNGVFEFQRPKQRALFMFWVVTAGAHLCYLFYILNFPVPWLFFEISAICTGAWLHLVFFSFLFLGTNFGIECIKVGFIWI